MKKDWNVKTLSQGTPQVVCKHKHPSKIKKENKRKNTQKKNEQKQVKENCFQETKDILIN